VQGFNEELRSGEDTDFCYRILQNGFKVIYQPSIKVLHNHRRNSFSRLIHYSYFYGRASGLYVKSRYPQMSLRNILVTKVTNPQLYPLFIIPYALGSTLNIVRINLREFPHVVLYAPFIFLSRVASHIGVWRWLLYMHQQQLKASDSR
jgi:GT2 family glycosyltransferase